MITVMEMLSRPVPVGAVVALKPASQAKSRLDPLPVPLRERLARSMALDTLRALAAAGASLVVVGGDAALPGILRREGISAIVQPEPVPAGMNEALLAGAAVHRASGVDRVLACVGDLPALTVEGVRAVLQQVDRLSGDDHLRAFVPDRSGVGTTMLIATAADLAPQFQNGSAAAHRSSGAIPIVVDDHPEVRSDVDTADDLATVIDLGVGAHTARLVDRDARRVADYAAVTVTRSGQDGATCRVVTDAGVAMSLPAECLDPQIRFVRAGQRLHAAVVGSRLISAWW